MHRGVSIHQVELLTQFKGSHTTVTDSLEQLSIHQVSHQDIISCPVTFSFTTTSVSYSLKLSFPELFWVYSRGKPTHGFLELSKDFFVCLIPRVLGSFGFTYNLLVVSRGVEFLCLLIHPLLRDTILIRHPLCLCRSEAITSGTNVLTITDLCFTSRELTISSTTRVDFTLSRVSHVSVLMTSEGRGRSHFICDVFNFYLFNTFGESTLTF